MATTALMARILADIDRYKDTQELVKASFLERALTRKVSPDQLHPNPEDEFCFPEIGPNSSIITKYCQEALRLVDCGLPVFPEPIQVVKMKPDGYMILNGHHRWAAAVQVALKKIQVEIVNPRNL